MKRKNKWKIKRIIVALIILVVFIAVIVNLYISTTPYGKLRKLDYSKEVIKLMNSDVKELLIDENKYSKTVNQALISDDFVEKNIDLYIAIPYKEDPNFIKYINKLVLKNYKDSNIIKIYKNLDIAEIGSLIKMEYVSDIESYINISYFRIDNLKRYIAYKTSSEKSYEEVMTYVNIGLDKDYYDEDIVKIIKDPDSLLVLVNKYNKLPDTYKATDLKKISAKCSKEESYLRKEAAIAFEELCQAAIDEGYKVLALSSYRTLKDQQETWDDSMKELGSNQTYYLVAKPGFSEHHTGLALDLASGSSPELKFGFTKDYTWTINNSYKYGFIVRYELKAQKITGYNFEPWHIRYVGTKVAKYIYDNKITFDEYMATR